MTFPEDRSGPLPVKNEWLDATRADNVDHIPVQSRHAADESRRTSSAAQRDGITASPLVFSVESQPVASVDDEPTLSTRTGLRKPR